ncbi:VOC family protein [Streptomyces coelicoflavus]|uniref:VOC family protein n=1 Tax=Streptomyces coelicoflavus TaxID=285562 RepID=A0A6N9V5N4_9ACTN|nr:VOC family protein [Streptomyces coelicoflavus]NEB22652.1 VOC family protein [Streptomyces coelicoflavus]
MNLAQIRLLVADFPRCYRFYRDVLALKSQFEAEDGPYAKFTADGGAAGIALQDRVQMSGMLGELAAEPTGYRSLVVLRVDELDRYCEEITARGAVLVNGPAPMTDHLRVAHLKDPAGNLVELQEWLEPRG